jgi:AbrB family looped-hinge helix DNA binding protein
MTAVTISPKYQIVIPKALRERLKLKPGQKLFIYERDGGLHLDPPRPISELFGIAPGIQWEESDRNHDDRF